MSACVVTHISLILTFILGVTYVDAALMLSDNDQIPAHLE